ncbi:MAG: indolepyruvate ferredoxin oxidoreductase subunit alpha [Clostridia bacterium]|nr:indolepyruvate ferredoxin oxidoreductase subunit alpha [Clostridia bacterium]
MKNLFLGNEAVARGLYESGCRLVSSYPGTPSTEITEYAAKYDDIYAEWAPNEKVAMETAIGASFAGARAFCAMKHVGLNVAADPLFTASYIGVNGGLIIAVADDPAMHSSQNEQDSRNYAKAAKIPMLEPSNSQECKDFIKLGYEISETFDTPVLLRLTTRVAHSRSIVNTNERVEPPIKPYKKNPAKNVMLPAFARQKHLVVEKRTLDLASYAQNSGINTVEFNDKDLGIITSSSCYNYAKEVFGNKASYLKLAMVYPLSEQQIKDFAASVKTVLVIEELDDIIESFCKNIGVNVLGKDIFPLFYEFDQKIIADKLLNSDLFPEDLKAKIAKPNSYTDCFENLPIRPPAMCCGCPHRGLFYALKKEGVYVSGDIGCYTLAASAPLQMMDTCVCMGASVSALHGYNKVLKDKSESKSVAVIGDSTFIHSGITGLINIAYNKTNSVVIILDNSITGMTGHQQNPTTGVTLKGDMTTSVDLEALCRAVGINNISVVDPYDIDASLKVIHQELINDGPSVIISRRPCALLKSVKRLAPLIVKEDDCIGCKSCLRIGCPAISFKNKKAVIDKDQCVGCETCVSLCPKNAISKQEGF